MDFDTLTFRKMHTIERTADVAVNISRWKDRRFLGLLELLDKEVGDSVDRNFLDFFFGIRASRTKAKVPLSVMDDSARLQKTRWSTALSKVLVRSDKPVGETVESRAGSHVADRAVRLIHSLLVLDFQDSGNLEAVVDLLQPFLGGERGAQDWTREKNTRPIFCDAGRRMRVVFRVVERMEKHARGAHQRIGVLVPTLDELPEITVLSSEKQVAVVGCLIVEIDEDFLRRDDYESIKALERDMNVATATIGKLTGIRAATASPTAPP
jgi:hypothetical protein